MDHPQPAAPVYQHRLTPVGIIGSALAVLCPLVLGALLPDWLSTASYDRPSGVVVLLAGLGAQIGLILLFVGREYVPVTANAAERFAAPAAAPRVAGRNHPMESTRRY